jgi:LAO/AO transport system kinase
MSKKKSQKTALHLMKGIEQPAQMNTKVMQSAKLKNVASDMNITELFEKLRNGDRASLAKAITLIESNLEKDSVFAHKLVELCLPYSGNSLRIGVTGVPGVGKSTFIEAIGMYLISLDKKVAVLAVDPSSERSKGSILGDKTRMEQLSSHPHAFIRPSPSSGTLGGVARKTRETMILCEAAGYNVILIETVGVGQSETLVKSMVDFFLLLMLAGAGDELQGIKRGIMEMADAIIIHKADGDNLRHAERMVPVYQNALHLFRTPESGVLPQVEICSSINGFHIQEVWNIVEQHITTTQSNGYFKNNRKQQDITELHQTIDTVLLHSFYNNTAVKEAFSKIEHEVNQNITSPYHAARKLIELYNHSKEKK